MSVRMELSRILIRELNDYQIIELREVLPDDADESSARSFPICIGLPEAQAIERRLKGVTIKRPQTHDLLAAVIRHLGGRLVRITISDLRAGTFFARLIVEQDGREIEIDSRPSDAIALGVAEDVPIFVAEHVLARTQAGQELEEDYGEP
ncbi:MAG: bifunctional nuclease family protein, partial [Phycisphaerales bacterium]|nr:bifunctional nuclease family protein [Phycisphaerales bacterium]